jgi:hypothetical protein
MLKEFPKTKIKMIDDGEENRVFEVVGPDVGGAILK